jgi:hypothetical protein
LIPEKENLVFTQNLCTNVYINFIQSSQNKKQPQYPSIGELLKQNQIKPVVYTHTMECYGNKKEQTIDMENNLDYSPEI